MATAQKDRLRAVKRFQRTKRTPLRMAKALRRVFESDIAKTWAQYFAGGGLTAYEFCNLVREQCGCGYGPAQRAIARVCPELFCDYWQAKLDANGGVAVD
jgi:hypothetical protein